MPTQPPSPPVLRAPRRRRTENPGRGSSSRGPTTCSVQSGVAAAPCGDRATRPPSCHAEQAVQDDHGQKPDRRQHTLFIYLLYLTLSFLFTQLCSLLHFYFGVTPFFVSLKSFSTPRCISFVPKNVLSPLLLMTRAAMRHTRIIKARAILHSGRSRHTFSAQFQMTSRLATEPVCLRVSAECLFDIHGNATRSNTFE